MARGVTDATVRVLAHAKLTLSLRVVGVRPDGYHDLRAEMVSLDLADELVIDPAGDGLDVDISELVGGGVGGVALGNGPDNLVNRALGAAGRKAHVLLRKRIPAGGGLGGGSADAAAVLRWAGFEDPVVAASIGADVPFCLAGGRALVTGIGETVTPLPFEERSFVLLLPPFGIDTAAVYRAWDAMSEGEARPGEAATAPSAGVNDLERPAIAVEPRLARWRDALEEATGQRPSLAGSGSTWFVAGDPAELGLAGRADLSVEGERAPLVVVRTVPPAGG